MEGQKQITHLIMDIHDLLIFYEYLNNSITDIDNSIMDIHHSFWISIIQLWVSIFHDNYEHP